MSRRGTRGGVLLCAGTCRQAFKLPDGSGARFYRKNGDLQLDSLQGSDSWLPILSGAPSPTLAPWAPEASASQDADCNSQGLTEGCLSLSLLSSQVRPYSDGLRLLFTGAIASRGAGQPTGSTNEVDLTEEQLECTEAGCSKVELEGSAKLLLSKRWLRFRPDSPGD